MRDSVVHRAFASLLVPAAAVLLSSSPAVAQKPAIAKAAEKAAEKKKKEKPEFPSFDEVSKGFEKVVSTADGKAAMYDLWTREKDGQMLAELKGFQGKKYFFAMTVAGGDLFAGLQAGDKYVYWRRYDKRMALMEPMIRFVSKGDSESKSSVERLFTDRLLLDVPIVCMGPSGGPVIDFDEFLLGNARTFFGYQAYGVKQNLASIETAKAFPENVEVAWEVPASGGQLKTYHWSISEIEGSPGFEPRTADSRVGYFTTAFKDLGKYGSDDPVVRYINRWHVEPAAPDLALSPPKKPIVFYIEHTTPIRYRRFVRDGILYWNKAFEKVGIVDAIEVYYQDKATGAHMEKDPEDVRFNFVRWLNNDVGTAIGPSRIEPTTGEILDADIILTDGWIRAFREQFDELLPRVAMQGYGPEDLAWLHRHPRWDPRMILAKRHERERLLRERAEEARKPFAGHAAGNLESENLLGDDEYDGLTGRVSQVNGACMAARGKGFDLAILRMSLELLRRQKAAAVDGDEEDDDEKEKKEAKEQLIDGMPVEFIGPLLADLVAHEVGHTLGLRHNFEASSLYDLKTINSDEVKGKKPFAASVMDYLPININMAEDATQGDFAMIDIGPYDMWAIEYGYVPDAKKLEDVLARVGEPELAYATDEDTWGPDPLARRYDFAKDPLDYARNQRKLIEYHRPRLLEEFVEKGESWEKAREGYELTLGIQTSSLMMMSNWLGGTFVRRVKKGDTEDGEQIVPTEAVPAKRQREALRWVVANSFPDSAYGLTPKLLRFLTVEKWTDQFGSSRYADPAYPLHDRIIGIQSTVLTSLLSTSKLENVYDNEHRVDDGEDVVTVAEIMGDVKKAAWTEIEGQPDAEYTPRKPLISSLRRALQREHVARIVELGLSGDEYGAAAKVVASIARMQMRDLTTKIDEFLKRNRPRLDDYSIAHLEDCHAQMDKALNVQFTHRTNDSGGGLVFRFF